VIVFRAKRERKTGKYMGKKSSQSLRANQQEKALIRPEAGGERASAPSLRMAEK
jgi:hypothetical protein